ncbi:PEP/pyruvate-binding domain-containing protein [Sunxiuqinia indica]|uniref:PEP/pyruvate-binding domain-containing protein n=1 Tax=Sunxiuqinia indica TaxID=2692584 RepID=UPI001358E2F7|nr:PEP/pyruvate-binding domain-containing protein [Sunxiuqinia indica]
MRIKTSFFVLAAFLLAGIVNAQPVSIESLAKLVETLKKDPKGPYQQILWFCPDGSTVLPKQRCPQPGGVQRAKYKDEIVRLGQTNHIFLGQILATTPFEDFWDEEFNHARIKQYLIEKYLQSIDNGWVLRRAQYYRGASQTEDENAWGIKFLQWLLASDAPIMSQYFLVREAVKGIPHHADTKNLQNIRSLSLLIAEEYPGFMDIRVKIHGQPSSSDTLLVKEFRKVNKAKLPDDVSTKVDQLLSEMNRFYQPVQLQQLNGYLSGISETSPLKKELSAFITSQNASNSSSRIHEISKQMLNIREKLTEEAPSLRLKYLDISVKLEEALFNELTAWTPQTLAENFKLNADLVRAATACGYLELWEWEALKDRLIPPAKTESSIPEIKDYHSAARSAVEWGAGMYRAVFAKEIKRFGDFEPLTYRFTDDRIRSSILLPLGRSVSQLGDFIYQQSDNSTQVMNLDNQSHFRGLNPGFAKGLLLVVEESHVNLEVSSDKIYIFDKPPADLKPVAGIATVSEGNLVSHVQLLARNLGIPNAVLSKQNYHDLKEYSGQEVFFAVSLDGSVIMKPAKEMTAEETKLFEVKTRSEAMIAIPTEQIQLDQTKLVNLRGLNASNSGKLCGPKAANLGQLKQLFPDHVVEGLVVPFGIFKQHMDQQMPEKSISYWQFLNHIFEEAASKKQDNLPKSEIDEFVIAQLAILRGAIQRMPILPSFKADLENQFVEVFSKKLGHVPVFLRSDTNMEDLKDFTGAGLNLTIFNVLDSEKIIEGIKEVWASPYSERSYKWRQSYLLNPENVYPSILIIPSVDVDYSGVLITKGLQSGSLNEQTIAFSRGAGGAVDGQMAETYVLKPDGTNKLLSPAREPEYTQLPASGGTVKTFATFEKPILSAMNIQKLRDFAQSLKQKLNTADAVASDGPWDVELGFKDNKLWLFQVRPFVENKRAKSSSYLQSISKEKFSEEAINLNTKL